MAGILDALNDPEFRRQVGLGVRDATNRGIGMAVGAPVDLAGNVINLLIAGGGFAGHQLGLIDSPPELIDPKAQFGSSEWIGQKMQDAGMVSELRNPLAETLASIAIPISMQKGALAIGSQLAKAEQVAATQQPMRTQSQRGAVTWHGTPHKFEKFDASKIGSGEGAQMYGHGLYFAESKDVGKGYRVSLSPKVRSVDVENDKNISAIVDDALAKLPKDSYNKILARIPANAQQLRGKTFLEAAQHLMDVAKKAKGARRDLLTQDADMLKMMHEKGVRNPLQGALYKVDIDDSVISKMIDWDSGGSKIWEDAVKKYGSPKNASDALADSGVTGIKYFDEQSREAQSGTRNFVLFPKYEDKARIIDVE